MHKDTVGKFSQNFEELRDAEKQYGFSFSCNMVQLSIQPTGTK
jgi:hypothetical protein